LASNPLTRPNQLGAATRASGGAIINGRTAPVTDRFIGLSQHTLDGPAAVLAEVGPAGVLRTAVRAGFEEFREALLADARGGEIIKSALGASHDKLTGAGLKPIYKILA